MRNSSVDQIIFKLLSKEHAHLNSLQIYNQIRKILPAVNQSTVYRSLDRLVKNRKVSVSDMGTGAAVYEKITDGYHHHLVCHSCGNVLTIEHQDIEKFFNSIETNNQFKVYTNHLVLFGICKDCQINETDGTDS
ncbi:MAG: hypothetical protein CVU41_13475 [Chloroflexi bacterium HGW-Chloroflexi-3]|nr:MAG: hypothetical protein CVU41_13475 [Chloroflexi bacterium HGW-Chloroflexi-3]